MYRESQILGGQERTKNCLLKAAPGPKASIDRQRFLGVGAEAQADTQGRDGIGPVVRLPAEEGRSRGGSLCA